MSREIFVQMALKSWNIQIKNATKFFDSIDDLSLAREIAPGKNTIGYLMGHLVAVNDSMISLFGLGPRLYAHLDEAYLKNPDKAITNKTGGPSLREAWKKSNEQLSGYFENMSPDDWFAKHTAMTDQDLENDPGRNKLSVLLNRTNHVSYHLGQLILAKN